MWVLSAIVAITSELFFILVYGIQKAEDTSIFCLRIRKPSTLDFFISWSHLTILNSAVNQVGILCILIPLEDS